MAQAWIHKAFVRWHKQSKLHTARDFGATLWSVTVSTMWHQAGDKPLLNAFRPRQNVYHFADGIFNYIS